MGALRRLVGGALSFAAVVLSASAPATSAARPAVFHPLVVVVGASKSNNWAGYNQGTLEQGGKLFDGISASWVVPTASARTAGEYEFSSTWIGIGGGCVDAGCTVTDATLIQAGTEQDVDNTGEASYFAWYELIPAPSIRVSLPVGAGNAVRVTISETTPGVWGMTMRNLSTRQSWSATVPYSSSHATAEWIEETPLVLSSDGSITIGPMPNLSTVHIDHATTNGANAGLKSSEQLQLVDFNGNPLATPSNPDRDVDGFNVCSYASTCAAPAKS